MNEKITIGGNVVDVHQRKVFPGKVYIENGIIRHIEQLEGVQKGYILPGLVDSHVHIESSMLTPANFALAAVRFGTVATVSDPHEIANVLGMEGVEFMINNGQTVPLKFCFGAPSCVPATGFETSGAVLDPEMIDRLLARKDVGYLSEMMNYPGVLNEDPDVMKKIHAAKRYGKKIDGHAPGLTGSDLDIYIKSGIQTDHECSSYEEAREKIRKGMKIQIREGSAARNFEKLFRLIDEFPDMVMLCTDDLHPHDLRKGHINLLIQRGLQKGVDLFNLLRAATVNPVYHYNLNVGLLRPGDPADVLVVDDLENFQAKTVYIDGVPAFENGITRFAAPVSEKPNRFYVNEVKSEDLNIPAKDGKIRIMDVVDGELITNMISLPPKISDGRVVADTERDLLKIAVINRYENEDPAIGFVRNFGIREGALASSVAHDSHNIIAVGTNDDVLAEIIAWVNKNRGGIAFHDGKKVAGLTLPVAGIISDSGIEDVSDKYEELRELVKEHGCKLAAPFMTLSFMALLVIPRLKIGNRGLFDVNRFDFVSLFEEEDDGL